MMMFLVLAAALMALEMTVAAPLAQNKTRVYVELTYPLDASVPVHPIMEKVQVDTMYKGVLGPMWVRIQNFSMNEHVGSHIDMPHHIRPVGGLTVDKFPIKQMVNLPAVIIDITERAKTNVDTGVTVEDVLEYERVHGTIPEKAVVFMNSGWGKYWNNEKKFLNLDAEGNFHFPGWEGNTTKWLIAERKINGLGSDCTSIDIGNSSSLATHRTLLRDNSLFALENVANLEKLPVAGATVTLLPLNIKDGTGAPTRIIGWYDVKKGKNPPKL